MVEEIKRIAVDTAPAAQHAMHPAPSAEPIHHMKKKSFPWKFILIPLGVIVLLIAILGVMLLPLQGVIAKGRVVVASGKEVSAAIKKQDIAATKAALAKTRQDFVALKEEYAKVEALAAVPFLGAYIQDGSHALKAGSAGLDAADKAIEALEPNADLLGLKGKSTFVSGTADDRIQTAVKAMTALIPKIKAMAGDVDIVRQEIDAIDPMRYPEKVGNTVVRAQIVSMKGVIDNAANLFVNAQPLLVNLPSMLGEPGEKRYLVLFQNDKELRSTGGFITAYAQFRFVRGKAILEKADDIYALDAARSKKVAATPEITKYFKGVYELNIRDSNLSPDFKTSMQKFEEMYNTTAGHEKIDGIWAVDTHVLVEALRILGPIGVYGRVFSAETDKRCDCPRAVYELEDYSSRPVGYVRTARKDIIGVLLHDILELALGVSPSKYWGRLFQMLITEIESKHVLTYFRDPAIQKGAESFNMAGRIMTATESAAVLGYKDGPAWDYLHINQNNLGGAKSNMFVSEKFTKDTTVQSDGTVKTKLTIDYKNPYAGSDCGLESGGLCLNAPLRNWVRIYTPKGSKLVESRGTQSPTSAKAAPMTTYDSLEKTVFEGFLVINPLGVAKLEVTYTSPVKSPDGKYRLLIQRQPGSVDQDATLKLNGKTVKEFQLLGDTEIIQ